MVLKGSQGLALELELGNLADDLGSEALVVLGDQSTLAVAEGDDGATKLDDLESSELGNVSGTGEGDPLAGKGLFAARSVVDHVLDVVDETVTGGLGADQAASP